ncbi:hypothetical protein D3C76_1311720 [compost metagenome]
MVEHETLGCAIWLGGDAGECIEFLQAHGGSRVDEQSTFKGQMDAHMNATAFLSGGNDTELKRLSKPLAGRTAFFAAEIEARRSGHWGANPLADCIVIDRA